MPHAAPRRVAAAALALAACLAGAASGQVFKWVDEKGRTHYGEKPPEGAKATEVAKPTPPSDPARAAGSDNWKQREQEMRRQRVERRKAELEAGAAESQAAAERARRCRDARVSLDRLENVQRLYRYDDRGERVYFTDAEREPEKARVRREIQEHCADR